MHTHLSFAALSLPAVVTFAIGAGNAVEQLPAPSEPQPSAFVLRADPRWADEVNSVLARVAQPTEVVEASSGSRGLESLARRCGGRRPTQSDAPPTSDGDDGKLRFAPCARVTLSATVVALPGDTLEGIALRNGLSQAAAQTMTVAVEGAGKARRIDPKKLQVGDTVIIRELPRWTDILTRPAVDRVALVAALAEALHCGTAVPEKCLLARGVYVLDARAPKEEEPTAVPSENVRSSALDEAAYRRRLEDAMRHREEAYRQDDAALAARVAPRVLAVTEAQAEPLASPPATPATPAAVDEAVAITRPAEPTGALPVAPEQWPYDAELVASILIDKAHTIRHPAVIGVADGGLANALGAPLPASVFTSPLELNPTDGSDDDENLYTDDALGAGVWSDNDDARRSGDVGLCNGNQVPFATWSAKSLERASHGAVVASVVTALKLRAVKPEAAQHLPKIAFFRMLRNACDPGADFRVGDGEMIKALDYLHRRADVINISYTVESSGQAWFKNAVQGTLGNGEKVLVLPAGNLTPGDLDLNEVCPACLGNRDNTDNLTANRTIVVGAATRALRRASYSNFGARTVGLFAPGEPAGALDVAGKDASSADPATSYAAPYAALAVAILRSFGVDQALDIKDRLAAATWPLYDAGGQPEKAGVIDLVKVAAVRHHAVEIVEPGDAGSLVRRTYVGKLVFDTPGLVTPCPGRPFSESAVHAIRLDDPGPDGERRVRVYKRNDWVGSRRRILELRCRPEGVITLRTLSEGDKSFPLTDVRQIQFRWLMD